MPYTVRIGVFNVVPPVRAELHKEDEDYPFRGSNEERREYVLYFNRKLKEYCKLYNYWFVDVYDKYTDDYGFLKLELSDGTVHIGEYTALYDFLQAEQSNAECQHERVRQGVHLAQDRDVVDEHVVPQVAEHKG